MKRLKYLLFVASLFMVLSSPAPFAHAQQVPAKSGAETAGAAGTTSVSSSEEEIDEAKQYRESPSVTKIGALLGLTPKQAAEAFEVLNFAVLAIVIAIFLSKALPKAFRSRNSLIQKELVDARTATETASIRLSGVEARLAKLDSEISAMRSQAEKDAAAEEKRMQASVEEEKKKILNAAEQEIAAATSQARRQIQQYAAELAIEQAARKLVISAETDRLLVQNFARRLGGDDSKEGQN